MKDIKVQRKLMLVLSMVFCISVISHSDMRYYINKGIKSAYLGICERLYHGMLIVADRECSKFWETIADEETWDDIDEDEYQEYESKMYQGIDDQALTEIYRVRIKEYCISFLEGEEVDSCISNQTDAMMQTIVALDGLNEDITTEELEASIESCDGIGQLEGNEYSRDWIVTHNCLMDNNVTGIQI